MFVSQIECLEVARDISYGTPGGGDRMSGVDSMISGAIQARKASKTLGKMNLVRNRQNGTDPERRRHTFGLRLPPLFYTLLHSVKMIL